MLEAYERLIYDAVRGDHTLFTSAEGIERLWESRPLIDNPPIVRPYAQGTWGPNQIHQLIAPYTWRLPFERQWRDKRTDMGGVSRGRSGLLRGMHMYTPTIASALTPRAENICPAPSRGADPRRPARRAGCRAVLRPWRARHTLSG